MADEQLEINSSFTKPKKKNERDMTTTKDQEETKKKETITRKQ